ncbi:MAG: Crp/Fnr family transcriptional regulator [Deltaproteobacteria bacterium]|nr:Crp/Fnr family transcriptional regulator [Deltaproteobacteria bacterium]
MRRNKAWFFKNLPLFEGVQTAPLERFLAQVEPQDWLKKRMVWSPGDPSEHVFFIRSGVVKTSKISDEGRELTLQFYTRNDIFGEMAIFSPGDHSTHAEAYEDSSLFVAHRDAFLQLLRAQPEIALSVTRVISERRERLEARVGRLLFKTAHARLASLFLDLVRDFGVRDSRGTIVNLKLTHKEMASLIGATRETVSFAILDLRKEGLIVTEAKRVIIVDEDALAALMDK